MRAACGAWAPLNGARRRASGGTSGAPNGHPGGRWQRQRREVFNSATSRQGGAGAAGLGLKAARRARGRAFVHARPGHHRAALCGQIGGTLGIESGAAARRVHLCTTRQSSSARGANRRPQSTRRSEAPERGRECRRSGLDQHRARRARPEHAAPWPSRGPAPWLGARAARSVLDKRRRYRPRFWASDRRVGLGRRSEPRPDELWG